MLASIVTVLSLSAATDHRVTIAPGVDMPYVNLGGVSSRPSNYSAFLALGGRGLDTALTYGDPTQEKVAAAITATDVPRPEIFLTTKVPCCPRSFSGHPLAYCQKPEFSGSITKDVEEDVKILGKIDLLLLHWPCDTVEETMAAWTELEAALAAGHTRAIGISNANASLLSQMLPKMKAKPSVNQCGHSIGAHNSSHNPELGGDDATVAFCQENGISYSAYSPLGGLNGLGECSNAYGCTSFGYPIACSCRRHCVLTFGVMVCGVRRCLQGPDCDCRRQEAQRLAGASCPPLASSAEHHDRDGGR